MSKDTISTPATAGSAVPSKSGPGGAKTSSAAQAQGSAEADQYRIAARAYELYEERGRQEGQAVEDWLNAEGQLARTSRQ